MRRVTNIVLIVLICAMPVKVFSAEKRIPATISHFVGGYMFEGNQDYDDGIAYMIGLGYRFTENLTGEAILGLVDTENKNAGDENAYMFRFDALYHLMSEGYRLKPYVSGGIGAAVLEEWGRDMNFLADYGAGISYQIIDNIALRLDIRHIFCFDNSRNNLACTMGVSFSFGGRKYIPEPKIGDIDIRIDDDMAKASGTSGTIPESNAGMPMDNYELSRARESESRMSENLSPIESIKDAIIEFDSDSSDILTVCHEDLKKVGMFIKANPMCKVFIEGHSDNRGIQLYNLRLSGQRAENIRKYLIDNFAVSDSQIKTLWFGETQPIADNHTQEGMKKNRRAVIKIINP